MLADCMRARLGKIYVSLYNLIWAYLILIIMRALLNSTIVLNTYSLEIMVFNIKLFIHS